MSDLSGGRQSAIHVEQRNDAGVLGDSHGRHRSAVSEEDGRAEWTTKSRMKSTGISFTIYYDSEAFLVQRIGLHSPLFVFEILLLVLLVVVYVTPAKQHTSSELCVYLS